MAGTIVEILKAQGIDIDVNQVSAAQALDAFSAALATKAGFFFPRRRFQGVYLWGQPGRGKTMMMDTCFSSIRLKKRRVHWHIFLKEIHEQLNKQQNDVALHVRAHRIQRDQRSSTKTFASWFSDLSVVCFDEFHTRDPGNAALMSRFIEEAIERNVSLILTSNYAPDSLAQDSFSSHLVAPLLKLITRRMKIVHVAGDHDYRSDHRPKNKSTMRAERGNGYGSDRLAQMQKYINEQAGGAMEWAEQVIPLGHRSLKVVGVSKESLWVNFDEVCAKNRSYYDYIAMAAQWKTIAIESVPRADALDRDQFRRFVWLVDIVSDQDIGLLLHWPHAFEKWLKAFKDGMVNLSGVKAVDVERCISRLRQIERDSPLRV